MQRPTGSVAKVDRKRGSVWYARYRLPSGRQGQKLLGPAWSGRGRPPTGYFTKRTAEDWLRDLLDEARRGSLVGAVTPGITFAEAADETCATPSRTVAASRPRSAAIARSSTPICCPLSAPRGSRTSPNATLSAGAPAWSAHETRDLFFRTRQRTISSSCCTGSSGGR
jgi:hypothetical protein